MKKLRMPLIIKKKLLLVSDFYLKPDQMKNEFKHLEGYGVEFLTVEDHPEDTIDTFQERMLAMESHGPEFIPPPPHLINAIQDVDILIVHFTVVPAEVIKAAKNLALIGVLRGGCENVNIKAASEKHIPVVNAPGRSGDAVSDFTIGLMIAESKNIVRSSIALREGVWKKSFHNASYLHNLRGRTIGIIGFGEIGTRVAKKLKGFDVKLVIHDPYFPEEKIIKAGYQSVGLHELLRESDFVTLHLRLTKETQHLIGEKELTLMKPTAYIINTARADLIDESALVKALQEGKIGGAAVDVFPTEPLPPTSPFLTLDNVTITPHLAGTSVDTIHNSFGILGEELQRFFNNEPLQFKIN